METKKCCVPGCFGVGKLLEFPDPKINLFLFKSWIFFIGGKPSDDYGKLYEQYKERRMCNLHFVPIKCKGNIGDKKVLFKVPTRYGPAFWSENKKKIEEKLKASNSNNTAVLKEKNSILKELQEIESSRKKITFLIKGPSNKTSKNPSLDSTINIVPVVNKPEPAVLQEKGPSNKTSTNKPNSSTTPPILKRKDPPLIPVVRIERMGIGRPENKPEPSVLQEKDSKTHDENTSIQFSPTKRKKSRVDYTEDKTESEEDKTESEEDKIESEEDKTDLEEDKTESEEDKTDTDEDYQAEYLESDSESTDGEGSQPQEIEYLDMNKLDLQDNIEATKPNMVQPTSSNDSNSIKTYGRSNSRNNTSTNTLQISSPNNIQENTKPNTVDISEPNTENEKSITTEFQNIQPAFKMPLRTYSANSNSTQKMKSLTLSKDEPPVTEKNNVIHIPENMTVEIPQELDGSLPQSENPVSAFVPVLEKNAQTGKLCVTLKENGQPVKHTNQSPTVIGNTKPVAILKQSSDALQAFLSKHNLKPIDFNNSEACKNLFVTVSRLDNQKDIEIPMEILKQAKQLAASVYQNSNEPKSKTNVYVFDSKGSVLINEQLSAEGSLQVSGASAINETLSVATRPNSVKPQCSELNQTKQLAARVQSSIEPKVKMLNETLSVATGSVEPQFTESEYSYYIKREQTLIEELREARKQISKLKAKDERRVQRLKKLDKLEAHPKFQKALAKMPRIVRIISALQFRDANKKIRGRRFTQEEKELAMLLREECPTTYKYMIRMGFILPSLRSICNTNLQSDIESTIDRNDALAKLKAKVDKMLPDHRLCTLLFDEKLLSPANRNKQVVTTFANEAEETEVTFEADHALIFMVQGILEQYEEPVSYSYSFGPTNGADLALQIKSVIADLQVVGYKVLATICDHADNNRTAIDILTKETQCEYLLTGKESNTNVFKVNGEEIIALYDPPHLLKGIRNNLISKNLQFQANGFTTSTAKWRHVEMLLRENPEYEGNRLIPKLTECHVYPTKQGITKVKLASQVFSQTVAMYMGYLAERDILPPECRDTAELLLFFDGLFDSFNGYSSNKQRHMKPLLSAVKPNSEHHDVWKKAVNVLKTMRFVNKETVVPTPDADCWIWTIEGCQLLLQKLFSEHNVRAVWMRHINQDALERLFRVEVNPTPTVRARHIVRRTARVAPSWFAGGVVTQKVLKAIRRMNKQDNNDKI